MKLTKEEDICKDCVEYGGEMCDDCLEEMKQKEQDANRIHSSIRREAEKASQED